ncbi:MAG: hypothetical protein RIG84_02730 [Roseovarius sp.]
MTPLTNRLLDTLLAPLLLALMTGLTGILPQGAQAQGFQVRPMSVEADVPAGRQILIPIQISGTAGLEDRILDVEVAHLQQGETGAIGALPLDQAEAVPVTSAAPWAEVPETISVPSLGRTRLDVLLTVPPNVRGTYTLAVLVSSRPPEEGNLRINVRFLIPVILTINSRPARQNISLEDAAMEALARTSEAEGEPFSDELPEETTLLRPVISNAGRTFARIRGEFWLDHGSDDGRWRQVKRIELDDQRLLPLATIRPRLDLGQLIPEGRYRIRGELFVDGRRTPPLRKEIEFAGHPGAEELVYEIAMRFEPEVLEVDYQPKAVRATRLVVENPGFDPVDVTLDFKIPQDMAGRSSATVRGQDLSAVPWLEVLPKTFRLRANSSRAVRVMARFPDEDAKYSNYYAEINLAATFLDGQEAGATSGLVEISSPTAGNAPAGDVENVRISELTEPGEYSVALRFTNVGDVLLDPRVTYQILSPEGAQFARGRLASDQETPLVPLGTRTFGGVLTIADLEPGEYAFRTNVQTGADGDLVAAYITRIIKDDEDVRFEVIGPTSVE